MNIFDDLLVRLAAEHSAVCNENVKLRIQLKHVSSPDQEVGMDMHRRFSTDILHRAPLQSESVDSAPCIDGQYTKHASSKSLRFADQFDDSIEMPLDWRDFHDPEAESRLDEELKPEAIQGSRFRSAERACDCSEETNDLRPLIEELPVTNSVSPVEPSERWRELVQTLILMAADPPVLIDVRDVWVPLRVTKKPITNLTSSRSSHNMELRWAPHQTRAMSSGLLNNFDEILTMCILHPRSLTVTVWSLFIIVFSAYDALMAPLEWSFRLVYDRAAQFSLASLRPVCYTLDIILSFLTGYYDESGYLVSKGRLVAARYIKTWFGLDLVLVLFDVLPILARELYGQSTSMSVKRFARILRLGRLARLVRVEKHLHAIQSRAGELAHSRSKRALIGGMVKQVLKVLVVIHCLACAWYGLGSTFDDGWAQALKADEASIAEAYFYSCEWAIALINGTIRIYPHNLKEQIFGCVASLAGVWILAYVVAVITTTVSSWRDEKLLHLQDVRIRYVKKHKISTELSIRVQEYFKHIQERTAIHEALSQEARWLALLPMQLQKDLHEEARAKVIVLAPFFHELGSRCYNAIRRICYEAISCKVALWMDRVFIKGDTCSDTYFVESGMLAYSTTLGDSDGDQRPLDMFVAIKKISHSRRCLCEAALWAEWQHCGDLAAVQDSSLLALQVHSFAKIILSFETIALPVQNYAKRYVFRLNNPELARSDVSRLSVPFERDEAALNVSRESHFMFLSHYKVEAGTEAALMRDELQRMIEENPDHPASEMQVPVFLDSENLQDLMELESHVLKSMNLVVLLTPNILRRPWCLIEFVNSMENGINMIPVRVERPGMTFEFPTEASYYEKLRSGELFSASEVALFSDMNMKFSTIEIAVKHCLEKIALPFSPHKSLRIRRAELAAIMDRCCDDLGNMSAVTVSRSNLRCQTHGPHI